MFAVQPEPLDADALVRAVSRPDAGAVVLFYGVVRDHNLGRRVERLEYEAYPELARTVMREAADEAKRRFPVLEVAAAHRTGALAVGEASLLVAVSSGHRAEAFAAGHWLVDRLKERLPVWKREVFEGGAEWLEGAPVTPPETAGPSE